MTSAETIEKIEVKAIETNHAPIYKIQTLVSFIFSHKISIEKSMLMKLNTRLVLIKGLERINPNNNELYQKLTIRLISRQAKQERPKNYLHNHLEPQN